MTLNAVVAGLPGDFNSDGKVDAGDYATWRKALRKPTAPNAALANDGGLGTPISPAHYDAVASQLRQSAWSRQRQQTWRRGSA